ncbi:unnamed protein product [Diabrotica balteata]|uniref:Daxx histone-binding domain-containing protein n=1 Tax=Diabrotica balteata TaxID=107213 RepID=A0A9N9XI75_DIABA|nr:unnamed protein product [Diabrotica balteata]
MADIITLSSSDEEQTESPRKRIKPTPVPNLPNITITKVSTEQCKKPEIVSLCSDEETNVVPDDIEVSELTPINCKKRKKLKNPLHKKIPDPVVICDDEIESPPPIQQSNGDSQSIKENKSEVKENPSESSNIESTSSNTKKDSKSQDAIINESIEIIDEDIRPKSDDNEDKQLLNDLECTFGTSKDGDNENFNEDLSEDMIPDNQPCSSTSAGKPSNTFLIKRFLAIVDRNLKNTKYVTILEKFPKFRTLYNKCIEHLGTSTDFQQRLTENIAKAKKSSTQSVLCFNEVFQHLKEAVKFGTIEVDSREDLIKLKKLEKTIKRLVVIIKRLEETEIDFDLEEDSSYLQLERYMARLDKVYKKYCELLKKNPYGTRLTYQKLMFLNSEYNEINRAIIKTYKNNKKFPSYYDIEKLITKVVKESRLNLNESQIKTESKNCFQKLGELLQKRRRKELYESHYIYLQDTEDPASANMVLNSILKNNYLEAQNKIEKLVQEYVTKQDTKGKVNIDEEGKKKAVSETSSSDDSSDDSSDNSSNESEDDRCESSETD